MCLSVCWQVLARAHAHAHVSADSKSASAPAASAPLPCRGGLCDAPEASMEDDLPVAASVSLRALQVTCVLISGAQRSRSQLRGQGLVPSEPCSARSRRWSACARTEPRGPAPRALTGERGDLRGSRGLRSRRREGPGPRERARLSFEQMTAKLNLQRALALRVGAWFPGPRCQAFCAFITQCRPAEAGASLGR